MKVSVFTSSWNHGKFLSQCIDSVLGQSFDDFEYLIYDDGSTDNTTEVMRSYEDPRIQRFFLDKQPNVGAVINQSIADMTGDVWVWAPADDVLMPNLLERKMQESESRGHTAVIYSDWKIINGPDVVLRHISPVQFAQEMKTGCPIGMTGIWIPKGILSLVGGFPEHLECSEDFYWILKALDAEVEFRHIPEILYSKRKHRNSTTVRNQRMIARTVENIRSQFRA